MPKIIDILARIRFRLLAFKHCVIKKSKYEGPYARKMEFEGLDIKTQMIEVMRASKQRVRVEKEYEGPQVAFMPFEVQIGSRIAQVFQSLGSPQFADAKTYREEGVNSAHYKLQVGSIKCRLSLYFFEDEIAIIKTKLSADRNGSSPGVPDILSLLFGHRLPQKILDNCSKGNFIPSNNGNTLWIERRTYDSQVIAFKPQSQGLKNLIKEKPKKSTDPKTNCQVQNWYRKKFGTYSQVES